MIVLGVHDGHNSSVALLRDGELLAAADEERYRRVKNHDARRHLRGGMPDGALTAVLATAGVAPDDIDRIALPIAGDDEDRVRLRRTYRRGGYAAARALLAAGKRWRLGRIERWLAARGIDAAVVRVHHHRAHAMAAYATAGFDDALVVTLDGKGDLLAGTAQRIGPDGVTPLAEVDQLDSPGLFYSAVTRLLGYRTDEDEGKVTALAARGAHDDGIAAALRRCFEPADDGFRFPALRRHRSVRSPLKQTTGAAADEIAAALPAGAPRRPADVARAAQDLLEDSCERWLRSLLGRAGVDRVAVAGGVFANVALNRRLSSLDGLRAFAVHPAMGDAGLAAGACFEVWARHAGRPETRVLPDAFLGDAHDDRAVARSLRDAGVRVRAVGDRAEEAAAVLASGGALGLHCGRMEYGPRALGHRSILAPATDAAVGRWLNERLGRDPVMPFAPAILAEEVDRCVELRAAQRPLLPWMTGCFPATAWLRERCPGVVHVDGTVRAQGVTAAAHPELHAILAAYRARTGIPCVVNTSLNGHREPIASSPDDALGVFRRARLDALFVGGYRVDR